MVNWALNSFCQYSQTGRKGPFARQTKTLENGKRSCTKRLRRENKVPLKRMIYKQISQLVEGGSMAQTLSIQSLGGAK